MKYKGEEEKTECKKKKFQKLARLCGRRYKVRRMPANLDL